LFFEVRKIFENQRKTKTALDVETDGFFFSEARSNKNALSSTYVVCIGKKPDSGDEDSPVSKAALVNLLIGKPSLGLPVL
jgi:hypothetical protein